MQTKGRRSPSLPTNHEMGILRRLAMPGVYLMVTQTEKGTRYVYGDTGESIKMISGNPLDDAGFKRLSRWLNPVEGETILDGPPQRWVARRPGAR